MTYKTTRITSDWDEDLKGYEYRGYQIFRNDRVSSGYWGSWEIEYFYPNDRYKTGYGNSLKDCKQQIDNIL